MTVAYVNPPFLHPPVDGMYSHISSASPGITHRIGGQVAVDAAGQNVAVGDMKGQLTFCYECVDRSLALLGLEWSAVSHLLILTTDIDSYMKYESSVARRFFGDKAPPSTLFEVTRLVDRDWLVEIQADAVSATMSNDAPVDVG